MNIIKYTETPIRDGVAVNLIGEDFIYVCNYVDGVGVNPRIVTKVNDLRVIDKVESFLRKNKPHLFGEK